ncbi:4Fe-4S binding protein [Coralliovum pocilloporae]|uniref:4Fe-4S binding protein n=1 Tax=Coralliovum pocilloporae TaxID=3066369 RepID=UPI00330748E5
MSCSRCFSDLCTKQMDAAAEQIMTGDVMIACGQEQARFEALADELDRPRPDFVDLRDRAGWTSDQGSNVPKMAALIAEANLEMPTAKAVDVVSEGLCLILGKGDVALRAATDLADLLSVTVLLDEGEELPFDRRFDVVRGRLVKATGTLGHFDIRIDALQEVNPGGHGGFALTAPRNGGQSQCDIILDFTGGTPLLPAWEKRDGYLRADPDDSLAVGRCILQASHMVGTFEKPLYVRLEEGICAHSRAQKTGCSKCLSVCPTGAITSAGEHVVIDPLICAGCGSCSAVCPSGAITYDAPPVDALFRRIDVLARAYRKAGGEQPRLLVCDDKHGREMIQLAARFGRGLPVDVIPLELETIAGFGHAEMLAALGCGFVEVSVLPAPDTERDALDGEIELARAIDGAGRIRLLDVGDPDGMSDALYDPAEEREAAASVLPLGTRRQVTRLVAKSIHDDQSVVPLPDNAPYGRINVNKDACTLCLSCVSLCPSGALVDNPDMPQLRFQEDACLQCGLCKSVCPESAITLEPRLNLDDSALEQVVLHEEEPFACIECGALFGVRSTVEKVVEKLAGKHSMFVNEKAARMIQMCDNCRVNAQYHAEDNPFMGGERPRVRTTEDYLNGSARKDH